MQIPLEKFEEYIDEVVLNRGFQYFENERVREIKEISANEYEAIVEGSEDYTVHFTLINGIITEHFCDCPYDFGPVCKHEAAVFIYLNQSNMLLNKHTESKISTQTTKPKKRKTYAQLVDELLEKSSHSELKQFVRENASSNKQFRDLFLSSFAQYNSDESKEFYKKQVKSILKTASGRNNFIFRNEARIVGKAIDKLLESAQYQINNHNFKVAFYICTAVMEQMTEALQYSDDSDGEISGCVESAFSILQNIAHFESSEAIRKLIFDYCLNSFVNNVYSGWDWHIHILQFAASLLETEEEIDRILLLIENAQFSRYQTYSAESVQSLKYDILLKAKGENIADEFLKQNISNSRLRRIAIQNAFNKNDFEMAIYYAKDGVDSDFKDKPGLAKEWYDWLLKIAQQQNDTENIIKYARFLFIDNFRHNQNYYRILKNQIEPDKWVDFIEVLIKDILKEERWFDNEQIASIFIIEEWWDRLLDIVKKSPDFYTLDKYEKHLTPLYTNEIVELYSNQILKRSIICMSRSDYQNLCTYIKKIMNFGANDKATEIISYLKAKYTKKKAFIEELNKL